MITERHNLACSMTFKAISKTGSLGSCFVFLDIGSCERLAVQNFQVPDTFETMIVPKWLFPPRFPDKNRFSSSRWMLYWLGLYWLGPSLRKKMQQTSNERGWVFRSGRGQLRETRSTSAAPPATSRSTFPRQHRPKGLSILQRDIHLIEYCEDIRLQN